MKQPHNPVIEAAGWSGQAMLRLLSTEASYVTGSFIDAAGGK
jgi:hypothetical protein